MTIIATRAQERVRASNMKRAGRPVPPEDRVPTYEDVIYDEPDSDEAWLLCETAET